MAEFLLEVLTGDVIELGAQHLVAGQDNVARRHLEGGHVVLGHARIDHDAERAVVLGVLLNLLTPLLEDGLGANDESGSTVERLE